MLQVEEGQCGLCTHFGENEQSEQPKLIQIRMNHEAPESLIEKCGLPEHAALDLRVTAVSGCSGYSPAETSNA